MLILASCPKVTSFAGDPRDSCSIRLMALRFQHCLHSKVYTFLTWNMQLCNTNQQMKQNFYVNIQFINQTIFFTQQYFWFGILESYLIKHCVHLSNVWLTGAIYTTKMNWTSIIYLLASVFDNCIPKLCNQYIFQHLELQLELQLMTGREFEFYCTQDFYSTPMTNWRLSIASWWQLPNSAPNGLRLGITHTPHNHS